MLCRTVSTPIGELTAVIENGKLTRLDLGESVSSELSPSPEDEAAAELLIRELDEYFCGERRFFSLGIAPKGTEFQRAVWAEMRKIPYGETRTYGDIAKTVGKAGAARAVGQACHVNHILIFIPCHRVVSSVGLGGFALGSDAKKILLKIEEKRQN